MGLPSLKEKLDVKNLDLDIPDYFELEADVTDYELSEGMTIATNDIFNQLDTEGFDSLSELEDSMQTLQDSSKQIGKWFRRITKWTGHPAVFFRYIDRRD